MRFDSIISDDLVLAELGRRLARQRVVLGLTQAELAEQAGIAKRTLERVEAGGGSQMITWIRLLRALGLMEHIDHLVPTQEFSPMALLREAKEGVGKVRKRVRTPRIEQAKQCEIKEKPQKTWTWSKDS